MTTAAAALPSAAHDVHAAARSHKRASDWHRQQARDLMRRYDELKAQLAELGITLHTDTGPERSHSHGNRRP